MFLRGRSGCDADGLGLRFTVNKHTGGAGARDESPHRFTLTVCVASQVSVQGQNEVAPLVIAGPPMTNRVCNSQMYCERSDYEARFDNHTNDLSLYQHDIVDLFSWADNSKFCHL